MAGQLLVFSRAMPGREAEFNAWYDGQHIPDTLRLAPEIRSAQRFALNTVYAVDGVPAWQYATIYQIDAEHVAAMLERINQAMGTAEMPMSDSAEVSTATVLHAAPMGEPIRNANAA